LTDGFFCFTFSRIILVIFISTGSDYRVIYSKRLGPLDERARCDGRLPDGEREGEPELPLLAVQCSVPPFISNVLGYRGGNEAKKLLERQRQNYNIVDEIIGSDAN
jgi:hypothetical protein